MWETTPPLFYCAIWCNMADDTNISDGLAEAATRPKKVMNDMGMVESVPPTDVIAADKYDRQIKAADRAAASGNGAFAGLRISRGVPPGTTTDNDQ